MRYPSVSLLLLALVLLSQGLLMGSESGPKPIVAQFHLGSPDSGFGLQDVVINGATIYALRSNRAAKESVLTACSSDAETLWQFSLPSAQYFLAGVRANGNPVLRRFGGPMEERNKRGDLVRTWPAGDNDTVVKVVGNRMWSLGRNGETIVAPMPDQSGESIRIAGNWTAHASTVIEPLDEGGLMVVDASLGRATIIRKDGSISPIRDLMGSALDAARIKNSSAIQRAEQAGSPIPNLLTLAATGTDGAGVLLGLIAPTKKDTAVIAAFDPENGKALREVTAA